MCYFVVVFVIHHHRFRLVHVNSMISSHTHGAPSHPLSFLTNLMQWQVGTKVGLFFACVLVCFWFAFVLVYLLVCSFVCFLARLLVSSECFGPHPHPRTKTPQCVSLCLHPVLLSSTSPSLFPRNPSSTASDFCLSYFQCVNLS